MKKKILSYGLWTIALVALLVVMSFVATSRGEEVMDEPIVKVDYTDGMVFLTEDDVVGRLKLHQLYKDGILANELDVDSIETFLKMMNEVEGADVYSKMGGVWHIDLKIKRPISRLINTDGSQFYMDDKGELMYLSNLFTADVVPVTGNFNFDSSNKVDTLVKEMHNDSLITIHKMNQIYRLSTYVCNDAFLSAQITQIHLKENGDFILIPRVGDQKIVLGKATDLDKKFKKLKVFYKKGMNKVGWEAYRTINLKFANQVVCTKR